MNGVKGLATAIKIAVQIRIDEEAKAKRGTIQNGNFINGSKSYPYIPAVDCNTNNGSKVWAQLSRNGTAVIVGE